MSVAYSNCFCCVSTFIFDFSQVRVRASGTRQPIYEVQLDDAESAVALRTSFSCFTRKHKPVACPPELEGVGVYNSVTLGTRVRISILRVGFRLDLFLRLF